MAKFLFIGAIALQDSSFFPDSTRPVALGSPNCTGKESLLVECPEAFCSSRNDDVAVVCQGIYMYNTVMLVTLLVSIKVLVLAIDLYQ